MDTKFLELFGLDSEDIEKELPRIERLFHKLRFGQDDVNHAKERIRQNFDVQLTGVRKILGVWLRELMALVLAKEEGKKIVHTAIIAPPEKSMATTLAFENVYCGEPGWIMAVVLGGILGKIDPLLEAAEEYGVYR